MRHNRLVVPQRAGHQRGGDSALSRLVNAVVGGLDRASEQRRRAFARRWRGAFLQDAFHGKARSDLAALLSAYSVGQDEDPAAPPRLLGIGGLPGVRAGALTFASNQVRMRLPADPRRGWQLTQAVVDRLGAEGATEAEGR